MYVMEVDGLFSQWCKAKKQSRVVMKIVSSGVRLRNLSPKCTSNVALGPVKSNLALYLFPHL